MKTTAMKAGNPSKEGEVTKQIEEQTSKIPSDIFLYAALGMMATALTFKLMAKDHKSLFFGQWVAPLLLFGIYNKIVKTQGHDQADGEYRSDKGEEIDYK